MLQKNTKYFYFIILKIFPRNPCFWLNPSIDSGIASVSHPFFINLNAPKQEEKFSAKLSSLLFFSYFSGNAEIIQIMGSYRMDYLLQSSWYGFLSGQYNRAFEKDKEDAKVGDINPEVKQEAEKTEKVEEEVKL